MRADRFLTLDFGNPDSAESPWRLVVTAHDSSVMVALHWGDKQEFTHAWDTSVEALEEIVKFARTGQTQKEN